MIKTHTIMFFLCCILCACNREENTMERSVSLAAQVRINAVEIDNVIACASSSNTDQNTIVAYVYPRSGATDIRYYETSGIDVDKSDYQEYRRIDIEPSDIFNGYLKKFTRFTTQEKWVIITFFENDTLHISNPIRLKHQSKPTEFSETVMVDSNAEFMPVFTWEDGVFDDSKIYFQVISDITNELLSGTYTFQKIFQYYKLDNVVLNITRETPPQLDPEQSYQFTLMGVSEDNWVNLLVQKEFQP